MSKPISLEQANAEIALRRKLYETIATTISFIAEGSRLPEEYKNFYSNLHNAFLFDRASVLRHFFDDPEKIPKELYSKNTHLYAVLASHDKTEDISQTIDNETITLGCKIGGPTIIISGVSEVKKSTTSSNDKVTFTCKFDLSKDKPADQYPPGETKNELKIVENTGTIEISF